MSSQKGNINRTRGQKHQNSRAFKNSLHDTSKRTKAINNLNITKVCEKCKAVIEWKIKYKKYKILKNPSTCCKCHNKCVKEAYHTVCQQCSSKLNVCPKCGKDKRLVCDSTEANVSDNLEKLDITDDDNESDDDIESDDLSEFT